MADFPGSRFPAARWMAFQLRVNRQVGSLWITLPDMTEKLLTGTLSLNTTNQPTLLWSKLQRIETGIV